MLALWVLACNCLPWMRLLYPKSVLVCSSRANANNALKALDGICTQKKIGTSPTTLLYCCTDVVGPNSVSHTMYNKSRLQNGHSFAGRCAGDETGWPVGQHFFSKRRLILKISQSHYMQQKQVAEWTLFWSVVCCLFSVDGGWNQLASRSAEIFSQKED